MSRPASTRREFDPSWIRAASFCLGLLFASASFAGDDPSVRWGAVGHSEWVKFGPGYAYNKIPIKQQMQLLKLAGLGWYRTSCVPSNCDDLVNYAQASGIQILKAIGGTPDATASEASNYSHGYSIGVSEAANEKSAFTYFEAGNELDDWVGMNGDGSGRGQYNVQKYPQARGYIRGLIAGIHSVNAAAQVLVDDAGWCHYGFLQMLWEDGVRWNITAFHWYSNQGNFEHAGCGNGANVASIHAAFGLPTWITEYNSKAAATSNDPLAEATWISAFMNQVYSVGSKYRIEAAFVYELLDEPNLKGMESHFGIFDGNGNQKEPSKAILNALSSLSTVPPKPPQQLQVK